MVRAYVLVLAEAGREGKLKDWLNSRSYVKEAHIVYGSWDIIAKVEVKDLKALTKVLDEVRAQEGIKMTSTMIVNE